MNGTTHRKFSAAACGGVAFYLARNEAPIDQLAETLGGALVGYPLGTLPDLLEPATSPRHRAFFHSATFAVAGGALAIPKIESAQARVRDWANEQRGRALGTTGLQSVVHDLLALLARLVAGAVPAVLGVAYGSHLLLDATTPAGLPLI